MMLNSAFNLCKQPAIGGPIDWITKTSLHAPADDEEDERRRGVLFLQQYDLK